MNKKLQSILILTLLLPLASCGQKGPLTLPEQPSENKPSESQDSRSR